MPAKRRPLTTLAADRRLIAPSLLAADFHQLGAEIERITQAGADLLHVDIMDGHFVPNLSMGPGIVKSLRPHSDLPFDVHLMLSQPARYVKAFIDAGADHITFHVEADDDVEETLALIHSLGCSAGLSLRPKTPASALFPYLDKIDLILVMTVEPGFGGQSFMADMMPKVRELRARLDAQSRPVHLEVDGGVTAETAAVCVGAGATMLVAGTSIFRAEEGVTEAIRRMRD